MCLNPQSLHNMHNGFCHTQTHQHVALGSSHHRVVRDCNTYGMRPAFGASNPAHLFTISSSTTSYIAESLKLSHTTNCTYTTANFYKHLPRRRPRTRHGNPRWICECAYNYPAYCVQPIQMRPPDLRLFWPLLGGGCITDPEPRRSILLLNGIYHSVTSRNMSPAAALLAHHRAAHTLNNQQSK